MTSAESDISTWLRNYRPQPTAPVRLVCFPHAGGSASYFLPLVQALSPDIEVLACQYPGRQDRRHEPFARSVPELADALAERLCHLEPPVVFLGHSMGAVLAFEVARRLPQGPRALIVSGRRAPSMVRFEHVHQRDDEGLLREVRLLGGTDERLFADPELRELVVPAIRADYRVIETYDYIPGPPLACPITVLYGVDDPRVTAGEAAAWSAHSSAAVTTHAFPGGHFFLEAQLPRISVLIAEIVASPSRLDARDTSGRLPSEAGCYESPGGGGPGLLDSGAAGMANSPSR